jgi:hypothetical protein
MINHRDKSLIAESFLGIRSINTRSSTGQQAQQSPDCAGHYRHRSSITTMQPVMRVHAKKLPPLDFKKTIQRPRHPPSVHRGLVMAQDNRFLSRRMFVSAEGPTSHHSSPSFLLPLQLLCERTRSSITGQETCSVLSRSHCNRSEAQKWSIAIIRSNMVTGSS